MINLTKLYYVENVGCDDTTCGLVRISDEDLPKFKSFIENLNKNSYYQCMPKIHLYMIDESMIRAPTENDDRWGLLYLDGKEYVIENEYRWSLNDGGEIV